LSGATAPEPVDEPIVVDLFLYPNCRARMAVIEVIQDPVEIRGIIRCLAGKRRGLPVRE
jgi:hypothetical protein